MTIINNELIVPQIEEVLKYENKNVVKKFSTNFNLSSDEAKDIFFEMKKWLWLCAVHYKEVKSGKGNAHGVVSFGSTKIIDEMWHTFILFTHDYIQFCNKFFNQYIHHFPEVSNEGNEVTLSIENARSMMQFVYSNLGEETAFKWYVVYDKKYNIDALRKLFVF